MTAFSKLYVSNQEHCFQCAMAFKETNFQYIVALAEVARTYRQSAEPTGAACFNPETWTPENWLWFEETYPA